MATSASAMMRRQGQKMRAVVTGANGHLGATLCRALVDQGVNVVACVRKPHSELRLRGTPLLLGEGLGRIRVADFSLDNIAQLTELFTGSDVIFHTAAPTALWAKNSANIAEPIYEGTLNVIKAAALAHVPKIIYTSSCAAVGFHAPSDGALNENHYNRNTTQVQFASKVRAELDGAALAKELGITFICVCPPSVLGPGFLTPTPSVEPYVLLRKSQLHAIPDLSYSIVDVRDLAQAQITLAQSNTTHQRYIVGGTFVTTRSLLALIADIDPSVKLPRLILPPWTLPVLAAIDAASYVLSLGRTKRRLTLALAKECMGAEQKICDRRFRQEFPSWSQRPLEATIRETLSWIRSAHA